MSEPVIDVERLMEDVRARVAEKRAQGAYGDDPAEVAFALVFDDGPLGRLARLGTIEGRRATMAPASRLDVPASVARRATVKAVSPFIADLLVQVNAFNAAVVAHLRELEETFERELALERQRRAALEGRIAELEAGGRAE